MKNPYFPQHFRSSRPYFGNRLIADAFQTLKSKGRKGVEELLFTSIAAAAKSEGLPPQRLMDRNFLPAEMAIAQTMLQLELDGVPLYDMAPELLEALSHSDPGDMRLDEVRTPNRTYLIHWGSQPGLLLHGKHPVEGAMVMCHEADWRITLLARTPHRWLIPPEQDFFILRFPHETLDLPFDQAVDRAIEIDKRDIEMAEKSRANDPVPVAASYDLARRVLDENAAVLKRSLSLVGNCIAYLTAYPDDARYQWGEGTPESMLAKLVRGPKEAERTASKLRAMGFIQVHKVGLDFQQSVEKLRTESDGAGGTVRPHWRRGHWRHQAYGEKLSLRKLIWLRPVRVLGGPGA